MTPQELLDVIAKAKRRNGTKLDLSEQGLTELPTSIWQLTTLKHLDLRNNLLTEISSAIGQLTTLETLSLSGNTLIALPAEIGQLTSLQSLSLSGNSLTALPAVIGQLTALQYLFLNDNELTAVPAEILQLTALKVLDLRDNSLPIPPEILAKWRNAQTILAYIRQGLALSRRPLHEAKLLVLGQATVGKTSLIRRLTQGDYDSHQGKTEGIAIQRWPLAVAGQAMQVNLWDFGGQDIMHATHQFFLSKRSLYLLVLDNRANETDNRLDYWLKIIQSFGGDSPVIMVGNKSDQHPLDLDKRGLLYKYPTIAAIVETSCADGTGIAALQAAIEQTLAGLPHIHDELPETWFNLRQKLEALGRDYLSQQEYTALCQAGEIADPVAQSTLLGFLHDLGVVLNFRDDPRLEDTSILNPHWVTQAVYKVLNARDILAQNGLLTLATLHSLLDGPAYPRAKQMYILEMLRKFELCYDLEGQRDVVLLPDLLPKEQPDLGDSRIAPTNGLSFQYHYNVLPSSIISRFIVRLHTYIQAGLVWRSGLVLATQTSQAGVGANAIVRADLDERKIFINVNGESAADRRMFLAIIRSHFEAIHHTLPGLEVEEKVALPGQPHLLENYDYLLQLEKMGETAFVPRGGTAKVSVKACLEGFVATLPEERGSGKQAQRVQLRDVLSRQFTKGEIQAFCFDLAVPFAELKGETPTELAMALIEYMEHRDRLLELRLKVEEARPGSLRGLENW